MKQLLALRAREIAPRLPAVDGSAEAIGSLVTATWRLRDGSRLDVVANLDSARQAYSGTPQEAPLWAQPAGCDAEGAMPPWSVVWTIEPAVR